MSKKFSVLLGRQKWSEFVHSNSDYLVEETLQSSTEQGKK